MSTELFFVFYNSFISNVFPSPTTTPSSPPVTVAADPVTVVSATSWFSWPVVCTYLVLLLVFNNLTPLMGRYYLTASLAQYLLQVVPLVMGLTGLGPCAALNQLLMHLFSWYSPDTFTANYLKKEHLMTGNSRMTFCYLKEKSGFTTRT